MVIQEFENELRTIMGFYDFNEAPVLVYPHTTANEYPVFTELHERSHQMLAMSTTYGYLQRLLALLHQRSTENPANRAQFEEAFSLLLSCCFNVYEGVASYKPLMQWNLDHPERASAVYRVLPSRYREALALFECVLGPVQDRLSNKYAFEDGDIADWIARSALNSPILSDLPTPEHLSRVEDLLQRHSPDNRLVQILKKLAEGQLIPQWRKALLEIEIHCLGVPIIEFPDIAFKGTGHRNYRAALTVFQQFVDQKDLFLATEMQRTVPDVVMVNLDKARFTESEVLFRAWQRYYSDSGEGYLDGISFETSEGYSVEDREEMYTDVSLKRGDDTVDMIKDSAWFLPFRPVEICALADELDRLRSFDRQLLVITIFPNVFTDEMQFQTFRVCRGDYLFLVFHVPLPGGQIEMISPFSVTVPSPVVQSIVQHFELFNVAWKIDERVHKYAQEVGLGLPELRSPLFLISAQEGFRTICERIDLTRQATGGAVLVFQKVGGQGPSDPQSTGVCLVGDNTHSIFHMFRISDLNWLLLEKKYQGAEGVWCGEGGYEEYKRKIGSVRESLFMVPFLTYCMA